MKRIFMLSSQLLFSRGVEDLLRQQTGVEIVGHEADPTKAIEQIREIKPDVVILDSKDLASVPSAIVVQILKEAPGVTVIALNLEDETFRVYRGEQRTAQSVDDLLEIIEEDTPGQYPITSQEWASLAAGRAQVYGFLASVYNRSVDESLLDHLATGSLQLLDSLEKDNDLTGDLSEGLHALERFQLEAASRPRKVIQAELTEEYARLLEGSEPDGKFNQACEAKYAGKDAPCADATHIALNKAYVEGRSCLSARALAQPDFIGCELDFMQHLCLKESVAWMSDEPNEAIKYQAAECAFLKDHLIRWAPRFCDVLMMQTRLDFYRGIACLTKGFILNETYRVAELMESVGPARHEPIGDH